MFEFSPLIVFGFALVAIIAVALAAMMIFRRVVPTNEMHIVQSSKRTVSFGKDESAGNTYYAWPAWVPVFGVVVQQLPVSVFSCELNGYDAFDKGRLPFVLDISAFFRISDSNLAAQRVSSFDALKEQLKSILEGAIRSILAGSDIETILSGRAEFGEQFTNEVQAQLVSWGVTTVKIIELKDIRDAKGSDVIANIMDKKKSMIERESRVAVAENRREAEIAEINARRAIELSNQEAKQMVGIRQAEVDREVGIAAASTEQELSKQNAITTALTAEVDRVKQVKDAEIRRDTAVISAEEVAKTTAIKAEGDLKATQLIAEGIKVDGDARATAERLMQLAPVEAQIALAREIGGNDGYQTYLVRLEEVRAGQVVGVAQAEALRSAGIQVIATGGSVGDGVKNIGEIFTPGGGVKLGSMLQGLAATPAGKSVLDVLGVDTGTTPAPRS